MGQPDQNLQVIGSGPQGLGQAVGGGRAAEAERAQDRGGHRLAAFGVGTGRPSVGELQPRPGRTADRGLELGLLAVDPQIPESGKRRQLERVRVRQHGPRLLGREGPQAQPVAQVRFEAADPALVQPLGGQQQVHPE